MTEEVELKYRVTDPATGERLLLADQLGGLQATGTGARATQLEDRYVDTSDGALAKAGFAVRLRQTGADTIVSVKSLAATEGASDPAFSPESEAGIRNTDPARRPSTTPTGAALLAIDGRVVPGHDGSAGELGHQTIQLEGLSCNCGNNGCLEAYVRGSDFVYLASTMNRLDHVLIVSPTIRDVQDLRGKTIGAGRPTAGSSSCAASTCPSMIESRFTPRTTTVSARVRVSKTGGSLHPSARSKSRSCGGTWRSTPSGPALTSVIARAKLKRN